MALRHGDDGMCERWACAAPERAVPEMSLAASLDMEAIVREVVEAGLMDRLRRKKRLPVDPRTVRIYIYSKPCPAASHFSSRPDKRISM